MKNNWSEYFFGILTVKITGAKMEKFINVLINNNVIVWHVKRQSAHVITFKMKLKDVQKLRVLRRGYDCNISFIKREGVPFTFQKALKNKGIMAGVILSFILVFLLSNMIWKIDVTGASPQVEQKVYTELSQLGVTVGMLQFFIDDVETIQRKLTNQIEEITWIGVELTGTTYQFTIVEKEQPEQKEISGPQDLVASKKALVVDMFIEEGKTEVKINEYVQKGQLLVSGTIGREGAEQFVAAKGAVYGETWYKSQVKIQMETVMLALNGNEKRRHFLKVGTLHIPIWGFGENPFPEHQLDVNTIPVYLLQRKLPLAYVKETYREQEKMTRIYSNEEAINTAKQLARKDLQRTLAEDAKIKGEKVLHQVIDNGKITLMIHFQVIENISTGQPIVQGD